MKWLILGGSMICWLMLSSEPELHEYHGYYLKLRRTRAVDRDQNVYFVGDTCDANKQSVYVTEKYNKEGRKLWERRSVSIFDAYEFSAVIAPDNQGNVYLACKSYLRLRDGAILGCVTTKYDTNGGQLWVVPSGTGEMEMLDPEGIAVDSNGSIYITGRGGTPDVLSVPDYLDGEPDEDSSPDNEPNIEPENKMELDIDSYWKRRFSYITSDRAIITIKYDTNGSKLWTARHRGLQNENYWPIDVAVDDEDNIYVTGGGDTGRTFKFVIIKYSEDGKQLWDVRYGGNEGSMHMPFASVVDGAGNTYVTGWSDRSPRNHQSDFVTTKYDTNGKQQWVARYQQSKRKAVTPIAIAVDHAGNVYVIGYMYVSRWQIHVAGEGSSTKAEFVTIKYNTNGRQQWLAKYEGPERHKAWIYDLRVDTQGNIYAIGAIGSDALIIKYDANGNEKFLRRLKTASELVKFLSAIPCP